MLIGFATSDAAAGAETSLVGIVLCVVAALLYGMGMTFQKPALRNVSPLQVTWIACLTGWLICLVFTPTLIAELQTAGPTGIGWLVYLGLFPTSIGFLTWTYALSRTAAGRLGATTYLVPPVAIVISLAAPRRGSAGARDRRRRRVHRRGDRCEVVAADGSRNGRSSRHPFALGGWKGPLAAHTVDPPAEPGSKVHAEALDAPWHRRAATRTQAPRASVCRRLRSGPTEAQLRASVNSSIGWLSHFTSSVI